VEDVPTLARRAVQTALAPPTGPVFLSVPVDIQLEQVEPARLELFPPYLPDRRIRPPVEAVQQAADLLAQANNPAILAGSRVMETNAVAELAALAEQLGAPVLAESTPSHGRLPIPADHPLYAGIIPFWSPDVRQRLADFDVIMAVGINVLRLYIHREPARPIPEHIRLIHLDMDPWEIGKNYPIEVGLLGDPKAGLADLSRRLAEVAPAEQVAAARQRLESYAAARRAEQVALLAEIKSQQALRPLTPLTMMKALADVLPPDVAVVESAISTHHNLLEKLGVLKDPSGRFGHRGWALGWGLGCAIGVKLAWPERPVLGLLGDGSSLYGIQGLWTAAHHHIPVTFVIANNAQYKILKVGGEVMGLPQMAQQKFLGIDLVEPEVDFVGLARSLGVEAYRVTEPVELSERVAAALNRTEPLLLDVPIQR
jgi:benzoylformate decarboxylase